LVPFCFCCRECMFQSGVEGLSSDRGFLVLGQHSDSWIFFS
jgi:hypothetical protein